MGMHNATETTYGRMVTQPAAAFGVHGSNPCQCNAIGGAVDVCTLPGFEPPP